ncbi:autotransporter domain-containing protein [Sideroxydans lithotrophicus]|uniref:Outer membrane autotransporter barrel domain protein n=1 Tax=Sideroxydans lithotrophicus (strain ES-1) TaxID=580332 RepID=D5CRX0_SIDLE|nr:autotransporter domain-containing protein [Sideroxydans lithotrophicus]ADE11706.1 outer membrane autotransporter barrel domain protein [Sideroxydans lithotrophicus ES-1]
MMTVRNYFLPTVTLILGLLSNLSAFAAAPPTGVHVGFTAATGSSDFTGATGGCTGCHTAPTAALAASVYQTYAAAATSNTTYRTYSASSTLIGTNANTFGTPGGMPAANITFAANATNSGNMSAYFASFQTPVLAAPAAITLTHGQVYSPGYQIVAAAGQDFLVDTTTYTGTSLPPGITVNLNSGVVSGTAPAPATPTVYNATITATNASASPTGGSASFTIGVNAGQTIAGTAPASVAMGTSGSFGVTGGGSGNAITVTNTSAAGICNVAISVNTGASATVTITPVGVGACTYTLNQAGTTVAAGAAGWDAATAAPYSTTIAQGTQTVTTWTAPALPFYANNATATVGATLNSGLTATLSSQTTSVCTVAGTTVTGIAAGTCTITAAQAGNTNWLTLTAGGQTTSFAVSLASQTITMPVPSVVVGGGAVAISPTAPSGLAVTLSNTTTSQCTLAGSPGAYTLTGLHAGTNNCVLNATVAGNTQYAAVTTPQALNVSIGLGTQTISAGTVPTVATGGTGQLNPTSNTANPILYSTSTGSVCSVSASGLVTAAASTGGQTCTILLDQNATTDYNAATQVAVNITVGLYGQTITLGTVTAVYYQPAGTTYGTGTISATASNSATPATASPSVTFTSNTPATCSVGLTTGVITGLAGGTNNCTIVGNVAGVTGVLNPATLTFPSISILQTGQTLGFGAAPSISVGTTANASATSTSAANTATGLAVTYGTSSASTICTVNASSGAVTGTGVGTCVVTADQAGNANYSAAPRVTQNVSITIGSQTLVWGAAPTVSYQGTGSVSATSQVTSNSTPTLLPVTYSSLTPTICSVVSNTGVITGLAGGTCTIAANQSGTANYSPATQVTQSFAINPIAQSINMTAVTGLVVGGTVTLSSTTTSGLAVTYSSATTGICTVSGNVVTGVAVGTCTINANQAGDTNYQAATQASQNVTVGQGNQTITFGTAPAVNVGGTGTVSATASSGLAVTFTSLTSSVCTVTAGTTVNGVTTGTCTIAANQAGNANWTTAAQVTQTFSITYLPPTAGAASLTAQLNTAATLDLAPFITGIGVTGVSISVQPAHGTISVSGTRVTYTPNSNYFGSDSFKYLAYNAGGVSPAAAAVSVTVSGRPDPTKDAHVTGLVDIQTATVKRFGMAQVFNFQQRLESRHHAAYYPMASASPAGTGSPIGPADSGPPPAPAGGAAPGQTQNYFNSWQPGTVLAYANDPQTLMLAPDRLNSGGNNSSPLFGTLMSAVTGAITTSSLNLGAISNAVGSAQDESFSRLDIWAAGNLRFGTTTQDGVNTQFSTDGISVGVDKRMDRKLTVGMGMGYARDNSSIGTDGTNSTSSGNSVAGYASYQMDSGNFLDGLLGYGKVNFNTNRYVAAVNDFARASRTGDQIFGSVSFGYEYHKEGLLWSPYGRFDFDFDRLNAGTESGAGINALSYASQNMRTSHLTFGMRGESVHQTTFGVVQPHARFEYQHGLETNGQTSVSYADLLGVQYSIAGTSQNTNAVVLGLGSDFLLSDKLKLSFDYQRLRSSGFENYQSINFRLTKTLSGKNDLAELLDESYNASLEHPSGLLVAAGFAYDDNVSRASEVLDKLSDTIYSLTVSKGLVFAVSRHTRLTVSGFMDVEKFRNYAGLGHVSGGMQGEYMYRSSGEFGAPTYGIFARFEADQYESTLRDGTHSSAGLTLRKPLTDRIDLFASVAENAHTGKSDVFNTRDVSGRMNFDYALAVGQTIYLTGEYRKGDIISSGLPSLKILDIATVFVRDDAFASAGFFDYRMKGRTVLFTLGYNIGFGNKDSADISWRRVQSTPDMTPAYASPLNYTVNQLAIVYLMAF